MPSCDICGENFGSKNWVTRHKKSEHDVKTHFELSCDVCGNDITKTEKGYECSENHYCSDVCKNKGMKSDGEYRECDVSSCDSEVWVKESQLDSMGGYSLDNTFCSKECESEYKSENWVGEDHPSWDGGEVETECAECGTDISRKPSDLKDNNFCTKACFYSFRTVDMVERDCVNCANAVEKKPYNFKTENAVCSQECLSEHLGELRKGEDNPQWKGGRFDYYGPNWNEQRKSALERDGYECQKCGMDIEEHYDEFGASLHVHHIEPRRSIIDTSSPTVEEFEEANRLENLRTLCKSCHREAE